MAVLGRTKFSRVGAQLLDSQLAMCGVCVGAVFDLLHSVDAGVV
jgi:hypothetical protein